MLERLNLHCGTCGKRLGVVKDKPRECPSCHKPFCKNCIDKHKESHSASSPISPTAVSPLLTPPALATPSPPSPTVSLATVPATPRSREKGVKVHLSDGGFLTIKLAPDTQTTIAELKENALKQLKTKRGGEVTSSGWVISSSPSMSGALSDTAVVEGVDLYLLETAAPKAAAPVASPATSSSSASPASTTSSLPIPIPTISRVDPAQALAESLAYQTLMEDYRKLRLQMEGMEKLQLAHAATQKQLQKYKADAEETEKLRHEVEMAQERLRTEQRLHKKTEDEFDAFVKYYEDDGTMVLENLDDTSAINKKIEELMLVVRRAIGAPSDGGETNCFLCNQMFSPMKWRWECQMCREVFCGDCCASRTQIPGQSARRFCVTCCAAILSVERARRARRELPKEKMLANARQNEKTKMMELTAQRKEGKLADGQVVYLVATPWLEQWKAFIAGGKRPDRIDNSPLFRGDMQTIREGLEVATDYRGLNAREWAAFYDWYGGGPAIRREKVDIYSKPVRPKPYHLQLSERNQLLKKQKQKQGGAPKRSDEAEKKKEEEILAAMDTLGQLPVYAEITDGRIARLHGFDQKAFNRLASDHKSKSGGELMSPSGPSPLPSEPLSPSPISPSPTTDKDDIELQVRGKSSSTDVEGGEKEEVDV